MTGGVLSPQKKAGWAVLECPWILVKVTNQLGRSGWPINAIPESGVRVTLGWQAQMQTHLHLDIGLKPVRNKRALMEQDLSSRRQVELRYPGGYGAVLGWAEGEDYPGPVLVWTAHHRGVFASSTDSLSTAPRA